MDRGLWKGIRTDPRNWLHTSYRLQKACLSYCFLRKIRMRHRQLASFQEFGLDWFLLGTQKSLDQTLGLHLMGWRSILDRSIRYQPNLLRHHLSSLYSNHRHWRHSRSRRSRWYHRRQNLGRHCSCSRHFRSFQSWTRSWSPRIPGLQHLWGQSCRSRRIRSCQRWTRSWILKIPGNQHLKGHSCRSWRIGSYQR